MSTVLYLHDAPAGISQAAAPGGEQSSTNPTQEWSDASTLRLMNTTIGLGQTLLAEVQNATGVQAHFIRMFGTPFLLGAQTVGGGTARFNGADRETNAGQNFFTNGLNIYVWRPATRTKIGTLIDQVAALGGTEPTAINSEQVTRYTFATSAVAGVTGDIVICEVWGSMNSTATGTMGFAYDGTTENDVENAVVTDHASLLELAEDLVFSLTVPGQKTKTILGVGA